MRKVYIHVQHGLSNRMRAYTSVKVMAERTNRELILIWEPDIHCDCYFHDLFTNPVKTITLEQLDLSKCQCYNYIETEEGSKMSENIDDKIKKDIYIKSAYVIKNRTVSYTRTNNMLKTLTPVPEIQKEIDKYDTQHMVAVHIRMKAGKNYCDEPCEDPSNWTDEARHLIFTWRENSHYKKFAKEMQSMIKRSPSIQFYLAADLQETYDYLTQKFPNNITYYKRDTFDRSKDQIKSAVVDLWLLSKCHSMLGSYWSSFTEMAKRLGVPREKIKYAGAHFWITINR